MEPILIIGAAVVALAAMIVGFARQMQRPHKISVPSAPPVRSPVSGNAQITQSRETAPAAIQHQSTKTDQKSCGEASSLGQAEIIEPLADEVPTAPSGS